MFTMTKKKKWILGIIGALVALSFIRGIAAEQEAREPKVAVIRVEGVITSGESGSNIMSGATVGADTIMKQLKKAREDSSVKGVLMRIDSPGGSAAASQEIAEEMMRLKDAGKPIVVSMGDMAASGGYWLAAEGNSIYANPATITGSIGVYMGYSNLEALYDKLGIREEKIKSGPHKDMLSPTRDLTPEERAMVQGMVDDMYLQFLDVVSQGRHMPVEKLRPLADGRIFTGRQAQDAGLVDHMGNYYDALNDLGSKVGIKGNIPTVEYTEEMGLSDLLGRFRVEAVRAITGSAMTGYRPRVQLP